MQVAKKAVLPTHGDGQILADWSADLLKRETKSDVTSLTHQPPKMMRLKPTTDEELRQIIRSRNLKSCMLHPIPINLIKACP